MQFCIYRMYSIVCVHILSICALLLLVFLLYFFIKYWLWLLYFLKRNLYKCLCHFDNIYNIKLYLHLYKQRYATVLVHISLFT